MKKLEERSLIPMSLQLFAEDPEQEPPADSPPENNPEGGAEEEAQPTVEELLTQLAQERAEKEKYKTSFDKAASEAADFKKKFRAKQTAEEQEEESKREQQAQHEKYVKSLETELSIIKATKRYMGLGMSEEFAGETAKAEIEGDVETLTANMKKHQDALIKAKEAEWIKSRPPVNAGHEENGDKKDPFLAGFNS